MRLAELKGVGKARLEALERAGLERAAKQPIPSGLCSHSTENR